MAEEFRDAREIERVAVKSSNLASVGYDPVSKILVVEFHNGGVYAYDGVTEDKHSALMSAESVGKYFISNIKSKYSFRKIG